MPELASVEGFCRTWLRTLSSVTDLTGLRQYFELPETPRPALPCVVIYLVNDVPDEMFASYPMVAFDCWGKNKHEADSLSLKLASEIVALTYDPPVSLAGLYLDGGEIQSRVPTGSATWHVAGKQHTPKRYTLTVMLSVRPS